MSSDDALFVQKALSGKWAVQWGTMSSDILPSPEAATREELFTTLDEAINTMMEIAGETEYGFMFPNPQDFGLPVEGARVRHG